MMMWVDNICFYIVIPNRMILVDIGHERQELPYRYHPLYKFLVSLMRQFLHLMMELLINFR